MPRYAAIDIGSNSIRMAAAEVLPGSGMRVLASERVVTRLGESVFRNGILAQEPLELTCTVLARMAQQYQKLDVVGVRAVATSAVRDARNQAEFIERASLAIGAPVEIVSGREESRLIHLGVQARWLHPNRRLLIADIGGGSAELISGDHGTLRDSFSKPLGAVRLREIFLLAARQPVLPPDSLSRRAASSFALRPSAAAHHPPQFGIGYKRDDRGSQGRTLESRRRHEITLLDTDRRRFRWFRWRGNLDTHLRHPGRRSCGKEACC
jgi:hypothetical protein